MILLALKIVLETPSLATGKEYVYSLLYIYIIYKIYQKFFLVCFRTYQPQWVI